MARGELLMAAQPKLHLFVELFDVFLRASLRFRRRIVIIPLLKAFSITAG